MKSEGESHSSEWGASDGAWFASKGDEKRDSLLLKLMHHGAVKRGGRK